MYVMSALVEKFLQWQEVEKSNSPCTILAYGHCLHKFTDCIGNKKVGRLTTQDVQKFKMQLHRLRRKNGELLSLKTQREYLVAVRSLLRYCHRNDIPALSLEKIDLPKIPQRVVPFLTPKEVYSMIQLSGDAREILGFRNRALVEVLYSTGCRISEVLALNKDQINLDQREVTVIGKGRKPRLVFLSTDARRALQRYLKRREDSYKPIFIDHSTNNMTRKNNCRLLPSSARKIVKVIGVNAGIEKTVNNHIFRHSFATHMLDNGADIRYVQELLGHASIRTTQIYTHVTNATLKRIHQKYHNKLNKYG